MSDKLEALKASARGIARLLGDIASFDNWEIDGDNVEIRFEDENGCDAGADVSITETADKASQAIGELLAALEEEKKRNSAYANLVNSKDKTISAYSKTIDDQTILIKSMTSDEIESQRNANAQLTDALQAAEQRIAELEQRLQQPIKLTQRYETAGYCIDEHYCKEADDGDYLDRDELIASLREQGFKVEGE